ncbi:MAG: GNAT family N-acetyltransferase [Chloroflexota bacterium]
MMAIQLPPHYTLRPATLADVEETTALFNAAGEKLVGVADKFHADELAREWQSPGYNLETDSCLAIAPNGAIAGFIEFWDPSDPHVRYNVWGRTHPDHENRGIGTALLAWAEARAGQSIGKAPTDARLTLGGSTLASHAVAHDLYRAAGYQPVRAYLRMVIHMDAPPTEPAWPANVVLRAMRPGDEVDMVRAFRDSFRDHWGFIESPFEEEMERWRANAFADPEFDPSLYFLAWEGEQIAGVSLCWHKVSDDAEMGWVNILGVRRPWRKQGLGLALLRHSFGEFYRRGKRKVGLGVDAASLTGATRLYEKAGMRSDPAREMLVFEKELRPGVELRTEKVA